MAVFGNSQFVAFDRGCSGNRMHFQIHRIQIIEDDLLIIFGHGTQLQCHFYAVCIFQEQIFIGVGNPLFLCGFGCICT